MRLVLFAPLFTSIFAHRSALLWATEQTKKRRRNKYIGTHTHTDTRILCTHSHTQTLMCVYIMAIATTKRGAGERGRSRERDAIFQCFICSPFSFAYTYTYICILLHYIILYCGRHDDTFEVFFYIYISRCFLSCFVFFYFFCDSI